MRQRTLVALLAPVLALSACASDIDDTSDTASASEETSTAAAGPWTFADGSASWCASPPPPLSVGWRSEG